MEIEESVEKKKKVKKRKPIFVYFILMVLLFLVLFFAQQFLLSMVFNSIFSAKNGINAISEVIWAGLVLIIVLIFGNKYIFTQQREKYFKSLKYIMPELIISFIFLLLSLLTLLVGAVSGNPASIGDIFNLALYCLFIGIVEEFLCRGWLFNEFLERYSDSKKHIILSIIFSSLIFGFIHYVNLLFDPSANILMTTIQVINAVVGGIFFALVYYKTKNIWVVVTSHAIWDFTLMLMNANSLGDCVVVGSTNSTMLIFSCLQSFGLTFGYLLFCYWMYRQTDLYSKELKSKGFGLVIGGVIIYLFSTFFLNRIPNDYYLCPDYSREKLNGDYKKISYISSGNKVFELDDYPYRFTLNGNKLSLEYISSKKSIELADGIYDYVVVENKDDYSVMAMDSVNTVLYGKFNKSDIENDDSYLETVKDGLELVVGPNISGLGVIETEDEYSYPCFGDEIGNILYFNKDGELKINN